MSANKKLTDAYREVFKGEFAEIVLADMAEFCGFYAVSPPDASADTLRYEQGLRSAFARIFHFLSLPAEKLEALERAAVAEAMANQEEGLL